MSFPWRGLAAVAAFALGSLPGARAGAASATEAPPEAAPAGASSPPSDRSSVPEVSPEELRALEEALGADVAAAPAAPPAAGATALQSLNPDLSVILDVAAAAFDGDPFQLGGHDPTASGFNFQQLELAIGGSVDPFFRFDANLVFSPFGVEVEEAYATTLALPANLQARAGQFLTRFGRINPTHPHQWSFVDQPLVIGKFFGSEGSRGVGLEGSWLAPLPWYLLVVGSVTDPAGEASARSFYGGENLGVDEPGDLLATTAVKQFFPLSEDFGLLFGVSGQFGPNPTGNGNRSAIYGADVLVRYRPVDSPDRAALSLQAEALFRSRQVPDDVLQDTGAYAQLVWTVDPEWETGVRYEWVEGVADDYLDPEWSSGARRSSVQLTYYPSHFSRIRLQGSRSDATFRAEPTWAAFLNLEVAVGAHGAHSY